MALELPRPPDIPALLAESRQLIAADRWGEALALMDGWERFDSDGILREAQGRMLIELAEQHPLLAQTLARRRGYDAVGSGWLSALSIAVRKCHAGRGLDLVRRFIPLRSLGTGPILYTLDMLEEDGTPEPVGDWTAACAASRGALDFARLAHAAWRQLGERAPAAVGAFLGALERALDDPDHTGLPIESLAFLPLLLADLPPGGARLGLALRQCERLQAQRQELLALLAAPPTPLDHVNRMGVQLTLLLIESFMFGRGRALETLRSRISGLACTFSVFGFILHRMGAYSLLSDRDLDDVLATDEFDYDSVIQRQMLIHFDEVAPLDWNQRVFDHWVLPMIARAARAGKFATCEILADACVWAIQMRPHTEEQWCTIGQAYLDLVDAGARPLRSLYRSHPIAPMPRPGEPIRIGWLTDRRFEVSVPMVLVIQTIIDMKTHFGGQVEFFLYSSWRNPEDAFAPGFSPQLAPLGVKVRHVGKVPADRDRLVAEAETLRRMIAEDQVSAVISFRTSPIAESIYGAVRIAPVQIFWPMSYDWPAHRHWDGLLTIIPGPGGPRKISGGRVWNYFKFSFHKLNEIGPEDVADIRSRFPGHFPILATVCRSEKLDSEPFLEAVARILKRLPDAVYLWTGNVRLPRVVEIMERNGVGDRCRFVGWVPGYAYNQAIDIFLDSFPYGSGQSSTEAMLAGKPLVSLESEQSVFGYVLEPIRKGWLGAEKQQRLEELETGPSGHRHHHVVQTPDEYVERVVRLATDPDFYREAGETGQRVAQEFLVDSAGAATTLRDALMDIIHRVARGETIGDD